MNTEVVEFGNLKEFEVPANDTIMVNFELIFSELHVFMKAAAKTRVKIYVAGRL